MTTYTIYQPNHNPEAQIGMSAEDAARELLCYDGAGGCLAELFGEYAADKAQSATNATRLDQMIIERQRLHRSAIAESRGRQTGDVVRASSEMSALMLYRSQTYSVAVQKQTGV